MDRLVYTLDLRAPARRRIPVELTAERPPTEWFLPAWTPGSYLIREYARHLNDFAAAEAGTGAPIAWRKVAKNRFALEAAPAGGVRFDYTLYAHELSVRTSDLSDDHAFLSGAAVFLWPLLDVAATRDVTVRVLTAADWDVATTLDGGRVEPGVFEFHAATLDELIDSPILAGHLEILRFEVCGKPHEMVLDGLAAIEAPDSLVPDTTAILEQAAAIFGGQVPYEEYKFLCMFTDAGRGGLEHLASSALLAPRTTFRRRKDYRDFMGLVAHEFFHVWNVKRMRPAELWDFDYEVENPTELLWVAEGFTAYFDDHLVRRAGLMPAKRYLGIVADGITELRRTPGRLHQSLAQSSYDAWIRLYRPDESSRNTTLSYYGNGALAAMCMDLRIRAATSGERSLDDVVRQLYADTFEQGRGYTHEDITRLVSDAAGCDLTDFVESLVRAPLDPDFDALFAPFGLQLLEKDQDEDPYLGVHFKSGTTTLSSVLEEAPADLAGLMPQDEVLALDDLRVTSRTWSDVFEHVAEVDATLRVLIARRGRILEIAAQPTQRPSAGLRLEVDADAGETQAALRRAWLFEND